MKKIHEGGTGRPIQPIYFYIDRNTPEKYIDCIIEAVRDWRPAFEKLDLRTPLMRDWLLPLRKILILVFMTVLIRSSHGRYQDKITLMDRLHANPGPVRL